MQLIKGQEIAILEYSGQSYINVSLDPEPPFTLYPMGVGVNPKITLWTMKEDETVNVDLASYIQDDDDINYYHIVGPRPKNIVRR